MNRDAFPPLEELPAMVVAYALMPALSYAILRNPEYRERVLSIISYPGFWQIVCVGLLVLTLAAAYLYYREWKEPLT